MKLIITADDLGASTEVNEAILACLDMGLVTRASILANGEAVEELRSRVKNEHCYGVHFNLTEGKALAVSDCSGICENGSLCYQKSKLQLWNREKREAVRSELLGQIEFLKGLNIPIQYADSHHHVHTDIGIASVFSETCVSVGITQSRPARTDIARTKVHLLWKKRANRIFRLRGLKSAEQMFDVDKFRQHTTWDQNYDCIELMLHPTMRNGRIEDCSMPGEDLVEILRDLTSGYILVNSN